MTELGWINILEESGDSSYESRKKNLFNYICDIYRDYKIKIINLNDLQPPYKHVLLVSRGDRVKQTIPNLIKLLSDCRNDFPYQERKRKLFNFICDIKGMYYFKIIKLYLL